MSSNYDFNNVHSIYLNIQIVVLYFPDIYCQSPQKFDNSPHLIVSNDTIVYMCPYTHASGIGHTPYVTADCVRESVQPRRKVWNMRS